MTAVAAIALVLVRAEEAWPAVFGGLIPLLGFLAVGYIVYRAVRDTDDEDDDQSSPRHPPR